MKAIAPPVSVATVRVERRPRATGVGGRVEDAALPPGGVQVGDVVPDARTAIDPEQPEIACPPERRWPPSARTHARSLGADDVARRVGLKAADLTEQSGYLKMSPLPRLPSDPRHDIGTPIRGGQA